MLKSSIGIWPVNVLAAAGVYVWRAYYVDERPTPEAMIGFCVLLAACSCFCIVFRL